jgi:hypothetical protein
VNNDVRSRIVLPIVIPIVILLSIAAFVGSMATLFLFNTKGGSLMLAAVAAGGILFTVSLAASQDKLDAPRRFTVVLAAALPLLAGVAVAVGLVGDVDDEDRMINVQPLVFMPDGAPTIAAENSQEFCLGEEGECEPVDFWEVEPGDVSDPISFFFDNREAGVPHNVQITTLEGTVDDPGRGSEILADSELVNGPVIDEYVHPDGLTWEELPEEWYFLCIVHPNMNGVGTVVGADGE